MISAMSSGMILSYVNYASSKSTNNNVNKMFMSLSFEMGSDGKTISKDQLSNYIKDAENGTVEISEKKLKTLKNIEKNWDELFAEKKIITMEDFQRSLGIFVPLFVDESTDGAEYAREKIQFYKDKKTTFEQLSEKVNADEEGITKDKLKEYLKGLLEKDVENTEVEEETEVSEEISFVTNLLADFDNITGGKEFMTSLEKETEYTV